MNDGIPFEQIYLSFPERMFLRSLSHGGSISRHKLVNIRKLEHYKLISRSWFESDSYSVTVKYYDFIGWNKKLWKNRLFKFVSGFVSGVLITILADLLLRLL